MNLSERVKGILLKPREEWQTISGETPPSRSCTEPYIVILAAIGPVASSRNVHRGHKFTLYRIVPEPITTSSASAVVHYILTLVGVYILALIIDALAPTFSAEKSMSQAFKVATYSYTPGWVIGIIAVIPALGILGILGLYGLYLLYVGLPILMKSPKEKSLGYTIAVIIAAIVIFVVISYISRVFISYPAPNMPIPRIR